MKACRVSNIIAATCASCGARTGAIHRPIFKRGRYCHVCCPVCAKAAEQKPAASTEPKPAALGSQWLDAGYGPRRGLDGRPLDPWYRDTRPHREPEPWVPRRNWFGR
jgi:hypothetical protein